ncbi:protein lin-54 homolog isoform X3 [Zootermopsis nevadensis]|uniref:protein lin-54 homolog isoform X3 n=1 Tax=Zootermopsis nevadensis TaxID=136037 RepID=UPI000B8E4C80|nr:protein lin-54 homolog isoform X3 [Zootermopsis nevadensis]
MTGGTKPLGGARAVVETLGLDAGALGDGDLSALTLPHNSDQFISSDLETLVNIQAELDRLNSTVGVEETLGEDLEGGADSLAVGETVESVVTVVSEDHGRSVVAHSPEAILPEIMEETTTTVEDMDMHEIGMSSPSPEAEDPLQQQEISATQFTSVSNNLTFTSTVASKTPGSSIVVIQSPVASSASVITSPSLAPTHVTVSGGQIVGKIAGMSSNVAITSVPQFQSLGQTLVTAKSADGNIVQLRPANLNRPVMTSSTAGNLTTANLQGIKPLQATTKRPATGTAGQMRNVFAKVIITGNQHGQQGQPIMLATSQAGETFCSGQPIKIISSGTGQSNVSLLGSPTKAITLAQAQQMGLLSPTKLQQILPSSPTKQSIIVNKLMSSPVKSPAKITMMPASAVVKSPTKILPAPVSGVTQLKSAVSIASAVGGIGGTVSTTVKPLLSPQKVIIRQGALKSGTVLTSSSGTGQVIRIPATQNVVGTSGSIAQLQMPGGRQLQYVRLVSSSGSNTSTVMSTGKSRTTSVVPVSAVSGGKPVSLSTMRSQQQTVKMVPIAPASPAVRTVVPKSTGQTGQRILIPASAPVTQLRAGSNIATLSASAVNQITSGATILPSGTSSYVMLPAQYVHQLQNQSHQQQSILNTHNTVSHSSSNSAASAEPHNQSRPSVATRTTLEPNGIRPRKPCNCTKSQCLKLYCDCFANGEFCHMCNCNNCFNNLEHEEDRQRAIKSCLERNPNAFRPKIGKGIVGDERRHNKGCNCKRSGCLKNYCECYEAKIPCSNNCKCVGCRNVEETCDKNTLRDLAEAAEVRVQQQTAIKNKLSAQIQDIAFRPPPPPAQSGTRQPFNFMTQEVLDATCMCLLAQAEEAERMENSEEEAERFIIEEFGRCLVQIIECATKTEANSMPI